MQAAIMQVEPEVLEPGEQTLGELATEANREHELALEAGASMVEHAIRCGDALRRAKDACPGGNWKAWLDENFRASQVSASIYMRLAFYQDRVRADGHKSIDAARRALVDAPSLDKGSARFPLWMRDEALRLLEDGMTIRAAAAELGVGTGTVQRWKNPDGDAERRRQRSRAWKAARRARQQAERDAAIKHAVRKAGGAIAEAYSMAERMDAVIAQAHRETEDREARRALSEAGVHYRKMRDEIVRALGVSS
jgi:transposase